MLGSFLVSDWGICLLESEIILLRREAHLHCEAVIINIIIINIARVSAGGECLHIFPSLALCSTTCEAQFINPVIGFRPALARPPAALAPSSSSSLTSRALPPGAPDMPTPTLTDKSMKSSHKQRDNYKQDCIYLFLISLGMNIEDLFSNTYFRECVPVR